MKCPECGAIENQLKVEDLTSTYVMRYTSYLCEKCGHNYIFDQIRPFIPFSDLKNFCVARRHGVIPLEDK